MPLTVFPDYGLTLRSRASRRRVGDDGEMVNSCYACICDLALSVHKWRIEDLLEDLKPTLKHLSQWGFISHVFNLFPACEINYCGRRPFIPHSRLANAKLNKLAGQFTGSTCNPSVTLLTPCLRGCSSVPYCVLYKLKSQMANDCSRDCSLLSHSCAWVGFQDALQNHVLTLLLLSNPGAHQYAISSYCPPGRASRIS